MTYKSVLPQNYEKTKSDSFKHIPSRQVIQKTKPQDSYSVALLFPIKFLSFQNIKLIYNIN